MGIDGNEHSRRGKQGIGFGSHVCRAGFLCETARGNFRVGDSIENGARQSRASLRAVAGTRASAERPVSLDSAELYPQESVRRHRRVDCGASAERRRKRSARMELMGSATRLRRGYVVPGIEGKVARVATSRLGNERVSIDRFIAEDGKGRYLDMQ